MARPKQQAGKRPTEEHADVPPRPTQQRMLTLGGALASTSYTIGSGGIPGQATMPPQHVMYRVRWSVIANAASHRQNAGPTAAGVIQRADVIATAVG
ncbi:hypothetical protein GUJ93_ZPchr0004g40266 [Zizania palustris]|uniref:Uncharacterized protein n=1 Tax=Zizania palustris TaxID=103762 RepID=A0A8J5VZM3_ZIZPA|nr:hypothetical protein GUJ93_ZPchr0004g40266 [Zizania palustris]